MGNTLEQEGNVHKDLERFNSEPKEREERSCTPRQNKIENSTWY